MNRKARPKKDAPYGDRIVWAWFDTVINPLLQGLRREQSLLKVRDWTWRFRRAELEFIRPVHGHLDPLAVENLEQLIMFHPEIGERIEIHDRGQSELCAQCGQLQQIITKKSNLRSLYQRRTSQQFLSQLGVSLNRLFGAYHKSEHVKLLAEYVVNNTAPLPDYYTLAPLWNGYKDEFLSVLEAPEVKEQSDRTTDAGEELLRATDLLVESLKRTRSQLSLEHDIPIALSRADSMENTY